MHRNLHPPAHRDVVERPLPLEAGERPLHRRALPIEGFPRHGVLPDARAQHKSLMGAVYVNDRLCPVLALDQDEQLSAGVSGVGHDIPGVKLSRRETGLLENIGRLRHVVDIARCHRSSNRKLGLAEILESPTFLETWVRL